MANKRQYDKSNSGQDYVYADGLRVDGLAEINGTQTTNGNQVINGNLTVSGLIVTPGGLPSTNASYLASATSQQFAVSGGNFELNHTGTPNPVFRLTNNANVVTNSRLESGKVAVSGPGIALIVNDTGQFGTVETSNFRLLAGGTAMQVNNGATFTGQVNCSAGGTGLNVSNNATISGTANIGTANITNCNAGIVATENYGTPTNGRFKTATSDTDYTLLGTKVVDAPDNTRIVVSGKTRPANPGGIEYIASASGIHKFYRETSIANSQIDAGRLTLSGTGASLIVQDKGQFGSVETSNFTMLAGGTPMVVNNNATITGNLNVGGLTINSSPFTYTTGSWAPILINSDPNPEYFITLSGYESNGFYTKIGRMVTLQGYIKFNLYYEEGTWAYSISNLPFAPTNRSNFHAYCINLAGYNNGIACFDFGAGSTVGSLKTTNYAQILVNETVMTPGTTRTNNEIFFTITFFTN